MRVVETEEVFDDPLMGDTDPEVNLPPTAPFVVRAGEGHWMAAMRRHDRRTDLDASRAVLVARTA
jgi:hypothetical protein